MRQQRGAIESIGDVWAILYGVNRLLEDRGKCAKGYLSHDNAYGVLLFAFLPRSNPFDPAELVNLSDRDDPVAEVNRIID